MKRHVLLSLAVLVLAGSVAAVSASFAEATPKAQRTTLTVAKSDYGRIVFDADGRALYAFTRDPRARSTCYGACAAAWPPYIVRGRLEAPAGIARSLLGTTRRRDGRLQLTFAGRPLYRYVGDRSPGVVLCQNVSEFGGLWLVARPGGTLVR
jgi:predicted lipoprotein with Yx(FWY)xxD motif